MPSSSACGVFQAKILEWVAISFSRDLPNPGIKPGSLKSPALAGRFLTTSANWEAPGSFCLCFTLFFFFFLKDFPFLFFKCYNYLAKQKTQFSYLIKCLAFVKVAKCLMVA